MLISYGIWIVIIRISVNSTDGGRVAAAFTPRNRRQFIIGQRTHF
ncbi:hypothetical protein SynBIOSE41_01675 [Synechococcus sp. BIOS-E4-1]|nr:hypothetical protein SynBIOSE41_01675 [Synechococcus sp. BIOS-E4-1]